MVQSSRRHLLEHRLAGRHRVATVVTDGGWGGDLTGALAVTHWDRDKQTVSFTYFHSYNSYTGQRDTVASASFFTERHMLSLQTSRAHLLFASDGGGQSKQTHWPDHCCYLRSSAKAMNCVHPLTTEKLPPASPISTQMLLMMSAITSVWSLPAVKEVLWSKYQSKVKVQQQNVFKVDVAIL